MIILTSLGPIIDSIFALFGIQDYPVTVQDFLWDLLVIFVGLFIVKYIILFVLSLMKHMTKLD